MNPLRTHSHCKLLLSTIAALSLFATAIEADAKLLRSGGTLGSTVTYSLDGDPFEIFVLIPSLNTGPIPLVIVDSLDPRVLEVGLDLQALWKIVPGGPTGQGAATYPLPLVPALQGLPLHAQFVTLPGNPTLVDEISNRSSFAMGLSGKTHFTLSDATASIDSHGATVLDDGRVLISGGVSEDALGNTLILDGFALFDPQTQSFASTTGTMQTARGLHQAIKLDDGRVLLSGGTDQNNAIVASCDIWDPATGQSTPTASMGSPRVLHSATKLSDGRVLVIGGASSFDLANPLAALSSILSSSELYDPTSGSWSPGPDLALPLIGQGASLLGNGKVLITGGLEINTFFGAAVPSVTNECRLYNPSTNSISSAPSFVGERALHAQVVLPNGNVLVVGGAVGDVVQLTAVPLNTCRLYNSSGNFWTNVASLNVPRGFNSAFALGSQIVTIGGLSSVDATTFTGTASSEIEVTDSFLLSWNVTGSTLKERVVAVVSSIEGGDRLLVTGSGTVAAGPGDTTAEIFVP